MARYRGPRVKKCRAMGTVLPGLTNKPALDRASPPGQHGTRRRSKMSDYKMRLLEKQKLRFHYGIMEKQFKRYMSDAAKRRGATGGNLVNLLESRLDNVVWRLGLAPTIPAARQMVVHQHITVDGKRVDRPSFQVKPGSEIGIREKSRAKAYITQALEHSATRVRPDYLEFDPSKAVGKMVSPPERNDIPMEVNIQAVIEFYSQQL